MNDNVSLALSRRDPPLGVCPSGWCRTAWSTNRACMLRCKRQSSARPASSPSWCSVARSRRATSPSPPPRNTAFRFSTSMPSASIWRPSVRSRTNCWPSIAYCRCSSAASGCFWGSRIPPICTPSMRSSSSAAWASRPSSSKTTNCRSCSTRPSSRSNRDAQPRR